MVRDDDGIHTLLYAPLLEASKDTLHYTIYVDQRIIDLVCTCECASVYHVIMCQNKCTFIRLNVILNVYTKGKTNKLRICEFACVHHGAEMYTCMYILYITSCVRVLVQV